MKSIASLAVVALVLLSTSCGDRSKVEYQRWTGEGDKPSLEGQEMKQVSWLKLADQTVENMEQQAGGFPVEGSFAKRITKGQEIRYLSLGVVRNIPERTLQSARKLAERENEVWSHFLRDNTSYAKLEVMSGPQVKISTQGKIQPLVYVILQQRNGELEELQIQKNAKIFRTRRLGSGLDQLKEAPAIVFPKGPKRSELAKVSILRFSQPQDLQSQDIEVRTASPLKILADQNLEWGPQDERFNQVQAYFLGNQFLVWLRAQSFVSHFSKISILTDVGYPEKTNTAFYYDGLVRLGVGDDVVFSRMSWDPSIVAHEISHGVIDQIARLPFEGEGGSLNEGFADTLATFFLASPLLGESSYKKAPFKRTVDSLVRWSDRDGGLYHDSAVVSGLFWELRKKVDSQKTMKLVISVLSRLSPHSDFKEFRLILNEQIREIFDGEELLVAAEILKERGLHD